MHLLCVELFRYNRFVVTVRLSWRPCGRCSHGHTISALSGESSLQHTRSCSWAMTLVRLQCAEGQHIDWWVTSRRISIIRGTWLLAVQRHCAAAKVGIVIRFPVARLKRPNGANWTNFCRFRRCRSPFVRCNCALTCQRVTSSLVARDRRCSRVEDSGLHCSQY